MQIKDLLPLAAAELAHLPNPRLEAELLLAYLLKVNRTRFIAFPEEELPPQEVARFKRVLARRKEGEPLAYITGFKEFYGVNFRVTKETLIPRDDTEIIVDAALERIPDKAVWESKHSEPFKILDLGTGSGAIALAVKKYRPDIEMTAVDFHPKTLEIAQENAERNRLNIEFIKSDWFTALPERSFNMILSNPPYIDPIDTHLEGDGVKFEPKRALIAEKKGLADLYTIIEKAPRYFKTSGWLLLEHGYDQRVALQKKMAEIDYTEIKTLQDYSGNDRVTLSLFSSL